MTDFPAELDRIHASGKVNGLLQAQVIALQYAVSNGGPMSEFVARQIAEQIGQAAATLQSTGTAQPRDDQDDAMKRSE